MSVQGAVQDAVALHATVKAAFEAESLAYLRTLARSAGSAKTPGRGGTPLSAKRSAPRLVAPRALPRTSSVWSLPPDFGARFDIGDAIGEECGVCVCVWDDFP